MEFIEAAKRRDNNAWSQIMEICNGAAKRFLKETPDIIAGIVSSTIERLMVQIDHYEPFRGKGNVEANFIEWINRTTEYEVMHWRDENKREERNLSFEALAISLGVQDDDMDLTEKGEDIVSSILHKQEGSQNNPEFEYAKREVMDVIKDFGNVRIQQVNILHYLYGHTTKEIAKILGEKEPTVNNWIQRYKGQLKRHLMERGIGPQYLDKEDWR